MSPRSGTDCTAARSRCRRSSAKPSRIRSPNCAATRRWWSYSGPASKATSTRSCTRCATTSLLSGSRRPPRRWSTPAGGRERARRLAQRGVPVNALVRAYRLGQRQINEVVFAELRVMDIPEAMRVEVIEAITGTLFEYIDWMSQQVVGVYEDERERWLENQNSLRGLRVREVLTANKTIDMDAAITSIRFPLRVRPLALGMWYPDRGAEGDELAGLQKFPREVGEAAGAAGNPLFVAADRSCGWGWLPYREAVADAVVKDRKGTR